MSYFIIDEKTDFDLEKIIISKPIIINDELSKIYLYYLDDIPKEIYIKTPPIRLIYNYKNLKYNQIKLPIFPIWEETTKFIKLIKKIEKHIRISVSCENSIFTNSIEKNIMTTIKLNITPNIKISSKINTTLEDLKINGEIEGIISMSHVWIKNNSYGLSLSLYQLHYIPKVEELDIDFFNINNNCNNNSNNNSNNSSNNNSNNNNSNKTNNIILNNISNNNNKKKDKIKTELETQSEVQTAKPMLLISPDILSNAMNKLNKTKIN